MASTLSNAIRHVFGVILETFGQNVQDNEETVFSRSAKRMADNWNNVDKTASRFNAC